MVGCVEVGEVGWWLGWVGVRWGVGVVGGGVVMVVEGEGG